MTSQYWYRYWYRYRRKKEYRTRYRIDLKKPYRLILSTWIFFFPWRIARQHAMACVTSRVRSLSHNVTVVTTTYLLFLLESFVVRFSLLMTSFQPVFWSVFVYWSHAKVCKQGHLFFTISKRLEHFAWNDLSTCIMINDKTPYFFDQWWLAFGIRDMNVSHVFVWNILNIWQRKDFFS